MIAHGAFLLLLSSLANAIIVKRQNSSNSTAHFQAPANTVTGYYNSHTHGRGIWKWSNALDAYQHHLAAFGGKPVKLAEVGVQSGGSIEMWKAALGPGSFIYGLDINPATQQFADDSTYIVIGDQGDGNMWNHFFTYVTPTIDVLIDDGGHEAHQMGVTLYHAFNHLNPGGFVAIEDIHGRHYTQSFYQPAAQAIHTWHAQTQVESVHLYPFLLIVKKTTPGMVPQAPYASAVVTDFPQLWAALPSYPGGIISLQNPAWGSLLSMPALYTIFEQFAPLNDYNMHDEPVGCATTPAPVCSAIITNSNSQAQIISVDIYPTQVLVHVAAQPPVIQAVRRGDVFIGYGF